MAEQKMEFCKRCKIPKELCPKVCNIKTIEVERKVLPEGTILHQDYQIYGTIGAGGMSVTYCACTRLKPVLLKQFNLTLGNREALDVEKEREKFGEEARKLLTLNHPNIVRIENIVTDEKTKDVFLVMELLYGETLEKYLQGLQEPMPEQKAYQILAPIFDALETVHQAGIIHRDIKPSNIMLCIDGTIKLIDFGSARQEDNYTKTALLTEGYAPPEQYEEHGNQGTWTDVYSMCATLYRMVTGKKPPASWSRYRKDTIEIPKGLKHREELKKGLALEAEDRWQTIGQLRAALGDLKAAPKEPFGNRSTRQTRDSSYDRLTEYVRDSSWDRKTQHAPRTAKEMKRCGDRYRNGIGVKKDSVKAFYWYQQAAQNGSASGMYNLGYCYQHAAGTAKDNEKAFYWHQKAAEAGNPKAMTSLGYCYENAIGTAKDDEEAFDWYKKAAEAGNSIAMSNTGTCYYRGIGTHKNAERAFYWHQKAAQNGSAFGMNGLGECYYYGTGTSKDTKKAFYWYQKAAEAGNASGMNNLGNCYYYGTGTSKDTKKAFYWYQQAAQNGSAVGMYNLGYCYEYAAGTAKDNERAFYWHQKAAEAGNASGMNSLGYCYENAIGTAKDDEEAFDWYKKAAEAGNMDGMNNLIRCYRKGIGTQKSWKEVWRWSKKVAEMKVESE